MANNPKIEVEVGANIEGLKVALTQAEKNLQRANGIFAKASKNVFALENEVSRLSKQYKQGTISEKDFAKQSEILNAKLLTQRENVRATGQEIARLNTLIKVQKASGVSGPIDQLSKSTKGLTTNVRGANSVAIEFNRIIQDAPFGIIGIGNNIQQLSANFSNLSKNAGGTGAALKAGLSALISPANLALLAISALTAGFTAYQMGAFDFLKSNQSAAKSLKELANEINNAQSKTAAESANITALRAVIEDETLARDLRLKAVERLQSKYPEIFGNADKEKLLNGELIQSYDLLTKAIIQRAEASLAEERIPQLNKEKQVIDNQIQSLQRKLALEESILSATSKGPAPSGLSIVTGSTAGTGQGFDAFAVQQAKVKELNKEINNLSVKSKGLDINIQGFAQSIVSYNQEFINLLEPVNSSLDKGAKKVSELANEFTDQKWQDAESQLLRINQLLGPIAANIEPNFASGFTTNEDIADELDPEANAIRIEEINKLLDRQKLKVEDLAGAFTGLGAVIGKAFNNPQFGTFIGQFAQFVTKIVAGAFAVSKANAVAGATQSSLFTGPAAAFTLPAFIAGAVGLVASAFSGIGGGGRGSAGGAGTSGISQGTSFTGQGGGSTGFNRELNLRGEFRIDGTDLVYVVDQARASQI
jgi:hypothetical protein